jgi:ubiquinol-cytochrome c reductase cytochrome b subunit
MMVILGLSLTGYLLPWDQKGFWATQVATNILSHTPMIGPDLQKVVVGGHQYGHQTLTHFYSLHVGILPPLLIVLLVLHIAVFRRHGVTAPPTQPEMYAAPSGLWLGPLIRDFILGALLFFALYFFHVPWITALLVGGLFWMFGLSRLAIKPRQTDYFWPTQAFRDLVVCLWIFAIMLRLVLDGSHGSAQTLPPAAPGEEPSLYERWAKAGREGLGANLDAPADLDTQGYPARPEWYFLFLFQLLKYFKGDQEIIGTFIIPNAVLLLLFLLPFFGIGKMRKFGHFLGIFVVGTLLLSVTLLTLLAIAADSPEPIPILGGGSDEAKEDQKKFQKAAAEAKRAVDLAREGIPEEGARYLLRNDPLLKGRQLWVARCSVCHPFTTDPALGEPALETLFPERFKKPDYRAADLGDYAHPDPKKRAAWIRGLLEKPDDPKYFGRTDPKLEKMTEWKKGVLETRAEWKKELSKEAAAEKIRKQEEHYDTVARWLADQANPKEQRDAKLHTDGLEAFGRKGAGCNQCHALSGDKVKGGESAPDLTGYGSQEWIRLMVMNPGHSLRHAGAKNMPAFRPLDGPGTEAYKLEFGEAQPGFPVEHLSDLDRELIIRWMTRDLRVVFGGQTVSGPPKNDKK